LSKRGHLFILCNNSLRFCVGTRFNKSHSCLHVLKSCLVVSNYVLLLPFKIISLLSRFLLVHLFILQIIFQIEILIILSTRRHHDHFIFQLSNFSFFLKQLKLNLAVCTLSLYDGIILSIGQLGKAMLEFKIILH
jgi:hypothetical protein